MKLCGMIRIFFKSCTVIHVLICKGGSNRQKKKTQKELIETIKGGGGRQKRDNRQKVGKCKQHQTSCGGLTFIMSVFTGAGGQIAVGDLSQSAEKSRALPDA